MVKLFIGNLPEHTDSSRLRGLLSQHVRVQECDVLKSFAFVHVADDNEADKAINRFNKYKFMGKELHVERSTSRLRKQPGMNNKCFTCGAEEHKTSQCPGNSNRKRNMSNGSQRPFKKPRPLLFDHPPLRPFPQQHLNAFPHIQNNHHFPVPLMQHQQVHQQPLQQQQQSCWGYKMGSGNENDPELPCPQNPELQKIYEQYMDSRTRYFFYREQLLKELRLQQQQPIQPPTSQSLMNLNNTIGGGGTSFNEQSKSVMRVDLTQLIRQKKEPDTMPTLSSSLLRQQTEQQKFIPQQFQQNTSIINNSQSLLPSISIPSLINTSTQLLESGGLNFSSTVSTPQTFQSQQQTAPLQYFPSRSERISVPSTSCYQNTYNALPTNYNTNISTNMPGSSQSIMPSIKQEPTPLAAIQTFRYN